MSLLFKIITGFLAVLLGFLVYHLISIEINIRIKKTENMTKEEKRDFYQKRNRKQIILGIPIFLVFSFVLIFSLRLIYVSLP